jgi:CRISPR-associated protein Cmr6
MFLKVLPGIGFEFRFKLTHTRIDDSFTFTADEKRLFFKQVLLTIGVGAKTNVGYGQFTEKKKSGQR